MLTLPNFFKKVVASLLVFVVLFLSVITPAKAASAWYAPTYNEWHDKVYTGNQKDIFGERYTNAQVWWIIYSLFSFVLDNTASPDILNCAFDPTKSANPTSITTCLAGALAKAKTSEVITTPTPQNNQSLLSVVFQKRSISPQVYFDDLAKNVNLVPVAHAQTAGFGFSALNPVLSLWKAVRNVTYGLFILAIIVLSFMIMFRVKLNPQTSVTIQSAIPKVVMALILVTFSYAIAGLLIDLMYVVIGLISLVGPSFFTGTLGVTPPTTAVFNFLTLGQPFGLPVQIGVIGLLILYLALFLIVAVISLASTFGAITVAIRGAALIAALVLAAGSGIGTVILVILAVILIVTLLVMIFKILFMLLKAYAMVLLLTIFSPFIIMLGVIIPGFGFSRWLKDFISNLAIFVTVGLLFLFSFVFLGLAIQNVFGAEPSLQTVINVLFGSAKTGAIGALTGKEQAWPPLLGGGIDGTAALLMVGVSFVIFTIIPKSAQMVESLIKGQPFNYGAALAESTSVLRFPVGVGASSAEAAAKEAEASGTWASGIPYRVLSNLLQRVAGR